MNRYEKLIEEHKTVWNILTDISNLQRNGVIKRYSDPCELDDSLITAMDTMVKTMVTDFNPTIADDRIMDLIDRKIHISIYDDAVLPTYSDSFVVAAFMISFHTHVVLHAKRPFLSQTYSLQQISKVSKTWLTKNDRRS